MAGKYVEFFGFRVSDRSNESLDHASRSQCPFIQETCTKRIDAGRPEKSIAGSCSLRMKSKESPAVICCPHRFYGDDYKFIDDLAFRVYGERFKKYSGRVAVDKVRVSGEPALAIFGHRWGGELRLPQKDGVQSYFVDWIVAKISPSESAPFLEDFFAIEVQTIDTTGNYKPSLLALLNGRKEEWSTVGMNWENVNKRILPQLIYKGSILSRESKCGAGLFLVTPEPVYDRIMKRLGGKDNLESVPRLSSSSVTCIAYDYDKDSPEISGYPSPLRVTKDLTTSVFELRDTFNRASLPEQNVYSKAIESALDLDSRSYILE